MKWLLFFSLFLTGYLAKAQQIFDEFDGFFKKYVDSQGLVDYQNIDDKEIKSLVNDIKIYPLSKQSPEIQKAFLINAYNILVIHSVFLQEEQESVQNNAGFFTQKSHWVGDDLISLNELEKEILFSVFPDSRLHFVLVCGAISCPPLFDEAYYPERLEIQLNRQTRLALNDEKFIRLSSPSNILEWSALFDWYAIDFGSNRKEIIKWINEFRNIPIPSEAKVKAMDYDWSLNGQEAFEGFNLSKGQKAKNSIRYVVSSTIKKGGTETKIFNNLYTQATGDGSSLNSRSNFFTTFVTSLYGVSDRFNAGFELRYRRVSNAGFPSSPLDVFANRAENGSRQSIATIGPKIRWAPVPKWGNFSIQSGFWFPLRNDLEGTPELSYIDWNGFTSWTQIMNDFTIGQSFSLFTEISLLWEDIGTEGENLSLNRISTPLTVIASYFPEPKTTLYVLNGYSPYWSPDLDWFYQVGMGAKYQFSRNFELELLYTKFTNSFLIENNGRASTFNFGIRINTQ